jgi:hypothetical protein
MDLVTSDNARCYRVTYWLYYLLIESYLVFPGSNIVGISEERVLV